ncbi:unnamed protein product [Blepharisma stoltei]|uniref:Protein kinase domain-containing protein n=1 Tax=Blepharisma stoltei TaxID=1481888 RepID=A0AAU9JWW6_9CILI|nr:unnamed protein product [Blepharisma stoltei]
MADITYSDIIQFIHLSLIPQVGQTKSEILNKLITYNYTLSLKDLQEMEQEITNLFSTNTQIAQAAQNLYYACYFQAVLDTHPFDTTYLSFTIDVISYLREHCPELDIKESVYSILCKVVIALISCKDINDVFNWADKIKQIKEQLQYNETEVEEAWVTTKIKTILLERVCDPNKETIKWCIQAIKMIESSGFNITYIKQVAIKNALDWIETTNDILNIAEITGDPVQKDEDGAREILELLKELQIGDEEVTSAINALSDKFGVKLSPEAQTKTVIAKERIKFLYPPLYSNTNELTKLNITVWKGVLDGSKEIAIKSYSHWKAELLNQYQKEREILEGISGQHSTFLEFYGSYTEEVIERGNRMYSFAMAMELCETTLIVDITRRAREIRPYNISEYQTLVSSLLEGFSYLEARKIYHQDIKPHNIFITRDGKPKIADFSVSMTTEVRLTSFMTTGMNLIQGTEGYMSPELHKAYKELKASPNAPKKIKYKPSKSDVYSLGLVFLQMYTLSPVDGYNEEEFQPHLQEYVAQFQPEWVANMLKKMLNPDARKRISFVKMYSQINSDPTYVASYQTPQ